MSEYVLSCCSTVDLTKEHLESRNLNYICFHYSLDGVDCKDDLWQSISAKEFYQKMRDGAMTQTSQISVGEFEEYFTELVKQGNDVLHISLSSGISGAVHSALMAAQTVMKAFPERRIVVIDSLAASSGYGLLVDAAADKRDEGLSLDELAAWVEKNKLKVHHWFFTTDLTYFVRGGRVSKVSGWFGGLLNICPLLNVSVDGKLIPRFKIRTKKRVIEAIAQKMFEFADGGDGYSGKCYMCQSDCLEDARAVADIVEGHFKRLCGKVEINDIGTTIGSHSGPGTVALFFFGKERID